MEYQFKKIGMHGYACSCCSKTLRPDDLVAACSDCGAVFCKPCVEAGALDDHQCEEEDEIYDD